MWDIFALIVALLTLATCIFALIMGGAAERMTASLLLASIPLGYVIQYTASKELAPTLNLVGDGVIALILLILTLKYGSRWLGAAMILYAAQFALHSTYLVAGWTPDHIYFFITNVCFLGLIVSLLIGVLSVMKDRRAAA